MSIRVGPLETRTSRNRTRGLLRTHAQESRTAGPRENRARRELADRVPDSNLERSESWRPGPLSGLHSAGAKTPAGALCLFSPRARSGQLDVRLPLLGQGSCSGGHATSGVGGIRSFRILTAGSVSGALGRCQEESGTRAPQVVPRPRKPSRLRHEACRC